MRRLALLTLALVLLGIAHLAAPSVAAACSLKPQVSLEEVVGESGFIALATVTSESEGPTGSGASYGIRYEEVWRGDPLPGSRIIVTDSTCGEPRFDVGDEVMLLRSTPVATFELFTSGDANLPEVRSLLGSGRTPASDPELFARVNRGSGSPFSAAPQWYRLTVPTVAVAGVAGALTVALLALRSRPDKDA